MADGLDWTIQIGLLIAFAIFLFLLLLCCYSLKAKQMLKMKAKSEKKPKTLTRLKRSSKTLVAHPKGKPRSIRADAKPDSSQKESSSSAKDHSHKDRSYKEHSYKEHKDQIIKELFQKESFMPPDASDQPHKEPSLKRSLKKIDTDALEKVHEVSSTFEEDSKLTVQEQSKISGVPDQIGAIKSAIDIQAGSNSSLKLDGLTHVEMPYSESQPAQESGTNYKMDSGHLANLNALGVNESTNSTMKRDLHETLYKQNISLFSIKNCSTSEPKKETSTLSTAFKSQNIPTKKV